MQINHVGSVRKNLRTAFAALGGAGALAILVQSQPAAARATTFWGDFERKACVAPGVREFRSVLWGIPFGESWEHHCNAIPPSATILGQTFWKHVACVNTGTNMWGVFRARDSECNPKLEWQVWNQECYGDSQFRYSAKLEGIPAGIPWEICETTPGDIDGIHFERPFTCHYRLTGVWGMFLRPAAPGECRAPYWGDEIEVSCTKGMKRIAAPLLGLHVGQSWEETCRRTSRELSTGDVERPVECAQTMYNQAWHVYGHWDVPAACEADRAAERVAERCAANGRRRITFTSGTSRHLEAKVTIRNQETGRKGTAEVAKDSEPPQCVTAALVAAVEAGVTVCGSGGDWIELIRKPTNDESWLVKTSGGCAM